MPYLVVVIATLAIIEAINKGIRNMSTTLAEAVARLNAATDAATAADASLRAALAVAAPTAAQLAQIDAVSDRLNALVAVPPVAPTV